MLHDGEKYTAQQILDLFGEKYLSCFETDWQPDISTVRKKLKEYISLGILKAEKQGSALYYRRAEDKVNLSAWADAVSFFSEVDPLGVVGSTLLDKLDGPHACFQYKHHYMLHALDSQILLQLLEAIGARMRVKLTNASRRGNENQAVHTICPLRIFIGTQGGRQYLLCYHYRFRKLMFFRLDYIQKVEPTVEEREFERYMGFCEKFQSHLWGTSSGVGFQVDHLEMTLHYEDDEPYIPQRLEREKRNGRVERIGPNTVRYITDVYDASELMPWLRTFIGRIEKLECSEESVVKQFYEDLDATARLYGGEG